MNRYYKFTTLLLVVALVSCYKDEPMTEPGQQGPSQIKRCLRNGDDVKMIVDPEQLHRITPQRAELIAVNAASAFSTNANTRTYAVKSVAAVEPILSTDAASVALSSAGTRAASTTTDTLMFAVNFANDEGFALVSFDDRDGDILMYSENGSFDMSEIAASNDVMKFHVDMVMAYQQDKLNRIREAKAAGIEYVGEIKMDTVSVEEFDMPTDLTENPYDQVATRAGMPGSGLPGGGGSGGPGMPGACAPGQIRVPDGTLILRWEGNQNVISKINRNFNRFRCIGPAVPPPELYFSNLPGDPPPPRYNNPPIHDMAGYYKYYGATMITQKSTTNYCEVYQNPLLKTFWDQDFPINKYCYVNRWFPFFLPDTDDRVTAGCVAVAMLQIMAYHKYPTYFDYNHVWNKEETPQPPRKYLDMDRLATYRTNIDLETSPDGGEALACLSREIGNRLGMWYTSKGSGPPSLFWGAKKLRKVFKSFSYNVHCPKMNFKKDKAFNKIKEELFARRPVLIYGFPTGNTKEDVNDDDDTKAEMDYDALFEQELQLTKGDGIDPFSGHAWVIDGYKELRVKIVNGTYRFDEYGNFNSMTQSSSISQSFTPYLHSNLGWGDSAIYDVWVKKGIYEFAEHDYSAKIFFLYDIYPNPK